MKILSVILLLTAAPAWAASCAEPDAPPQLAGASAGRDQVNAAISAFRLYQTDFDAFQKCLDDARRDKPATAGDLTRRSDAAYGRMMAAADRLAAELRAWAAKNGKPVPAS